MLIFFSVLLGLGIILYIVGAGATHGYAKHRWPEKLVSVCQGWGSYANLDENRFRKFFCTILWLFYWIFVWPFTKTNETTFSHIEKRAALQMAKNKKRIADLHATRAQIEASNAELANAEVELEREMGRL